MSFLAARPGMIWGKLGLRGFQKSPQDIGISGCLWKSGGGELLCDSRAGHLSFCTKVCYGVGGVPNQVASSATAFYLQLFLLDVAQIPAAQVSLVLFGGKVSGAAADPVAGFFINRSRRTGSGRLMPCLRGLWYTTSYCLFQALATVSRRPPFLCLKCVCGRGRCPRGAHCPRLLPSAWQSTISSSGPLVPYTALTMLLTPSPRERDSATAYRMTMEMAGTLMGAAAHGLIVSGAHGPHRCEDAALPGPVAVSPDATRLYSIAAAVVALTYPVCSSLLYLGVKERPDRSAPASGQGLGFLAGLGLTVRHPPYLKLVISFLFISAAVQVEQSYLVLFCTHASRLHDHVQGLVLTILVRGPGVAGARSLGGLSWGHGQDPGFPPKSQGFENLGEGTGRRPSCDDSVCSQVSAVVSTPLWEWVLQRFGKRMSAFGICVMVPFAILLAAVPTAPVAYVVAFGSGVSIAVSLLLPWSMLPDVVDDFQLQHQHGPGLETIFYSSYVFFTKLSGAGALGISTLSLEFAGYEAGACKQAEQVVVTLKVLIGAVPTCMILTGLCILMVGPTLKEPSQDTSHPLSLRRWAHGYTQ
ncbi:hypothetical protein HPG69_008934 [Diceros bicornis minor]|uniref:Major facilitator superfamily domain-containing protein 2B n=1 Tax=Diceros bicornis minor TaxID=77932 RepID=A0A7J7EBC3_DICBM|nr:hypothetical protein HPG69_008934 [Diceros bicornis minor]